MMRFVDLQPGIRALARGAWPGALLAAWLCAAPAARARAPQDARPAAPPQVAPAPAPASAPEPAPAPDEGFWALAAATLMDPSMDPWYRTDGGTGPSIASVLTIHPGQAVRLPVFLQRIGDDGTGHGRVTFDVRLTNAEDEPGERLEDIVAFDGPLPSRYLVMLSRAVPTLLFDDLEPTGLMTIDVQVTDHGSGRTVEQSIDLELAAWRYDAPLRGREDVEDWMKGYYQAPQPEVAVRLYLEQATMKTRHDDWNHAVLGVFRAVFAENPWLLDPLVSRYEVSGAERRVRILSMLHMLGDDSRLEAALAHEPEETREAMRRTLADWHPPDPAAPLEHPALLDANWGEFFATGRYEPVRRIVRALRWADDERVVQTARETPEDELDREAVMRGLTFMAARWSLESNMAEHPLVAEYAWWMLVNDELDEAEERQLAPLVAKRFPERVRAPDAAAGEPKDAPNDAPKGGPKGESKGGPKGGPKGEPKGEPKDAPAAGDDDER